MFINIMFIHDNLTLTNVNELNFIVKCYNSSLANVLCLSLGLFTSVTSLKVRLMFIQFISKHVKLQILIKLPAISDKYLANFSSHLHFGECSFWTLAAPILSTSITIS